MHEKFASMKELLIAETTNFEKMKSEEEDSLESFLKSIDGKHTLASESHLDLVMELANAKNVNAEL